MIKRFQKGQMPAVLLSTAIRHMTGAGVPDATRDARILLSHAMGVTSGAGLTPFMQDAVPDQAIAKFEDVVERRIQRQPVSQIIGKRHFATRQFHVTQDVMDPRPETEILIELAKEEPYARVLDLGVGSGAILMTLLADRRGQSTGVGVDLSEEACHVAFANAQACGVLDQADIFISDWFEHVEGTFDLIVSNPPYIAQSEMDALSPEVHDWEPHMALTDGADGLTAYRRICADLDAYLAPGGRFLCEIGPSQGAAVSALIRDAGLVDLAVHRDWDGRDRVVFGRKPVS